MAAVGWESESQRLTAGISWHLKGMISQSTAAARSRGQLGEARTPAAHENRQLISDAEREGRERAVSTQQKVNTTDT